MSILQELSSLIYPSLNEGKDVLPCCKVGDTVWAKSPTDKAKTLTGKVKRVGRKMYTITLKDGSDVDFFHKDVSQNYEDLHPKVNKMNEASTEMLACYKKKAGADASKLDKEADEAFKAGDIDKGRKLTAKADKRFSGIVKATKKQFDNDKTLEEQLLENAELHKLGKQLKKDKGDAAESSEETKPAPYGVEIGQVYVPADGSSGELTVVGLDLDKDDAIVQDSETGEERHIDLFKLAKVRYTLKDEESEEASEPEVSIEEPTEEPDQSAPASSEESAEEPANPEFKIGDTVIPSKGPHKGQPHEILAIRDDGRLEIKPKDLEGEAIKYKGGKILSSASLLTLVESYKDAFKGFKLFDKNSSLLSQVAVNLNENDAKAKWEAEIKKVHPTLVGKMKFKNRIEHGKDTTSAEIGDRSYGVFDNDENSGVVFKLNEGSETIKKSDQFLKRLSAHLKPLGFKHDRNTWVDDSGNFITVEIDTDEKDILINWAVGKKSKVLKQKNGVGFEKAEEVMEKLLAFAENV